MDFKSAEEKAAYLRGDSKPVEVKQDQPVKEPKQKKAKAAGGE